MEVKMEDVKLPGPHTRMVLFAETVFKLKFKLSGGDLSRVEDSLYTNLTIQKDIKEATYSILAHICNTGTPIAVKTRHIVVYPGCLPWKSAVYNKLQFAYGERELKSHPQVIFLLIHIYEVPPPPPRNGGTFMDSDMRSTLGKHLRSSQDICGQTVLTGQPAAGVPCRIPSAKKRLKMDASLPEHLTATVPSANDAALPSPTGHAQMDTQPIARKHERDEMEQKQPFLTDWDKSNDKEQPVTLTRRIVRSIMNFIGWN